MTGSDFDLFDALPPGGNGSVATGTSSDAGDVLGGDLVQPGVDESVQSAAVAQLPVSERSVVLFPDCGSRIRITEQCVEDWLWVTILTVPDVPRIEIPDRFTTDKVRVDLSGVDQLTAGEVKKLVTETLPDDQLQALLEAERSRRKGARTVLWKALTAEVDRRGSGYSEWVADHAKNPLQSRIVAFAWAVGVLSFESIVCVSSAGDRDELELLSEFWEQARGRDIVIWDARTLRTLRIRSVALEVESRRPVECLIRLPAFSGPVTEQAAAMRLPVAKVLPDTAVFDAWRDQDLSLLSEAVLDLAEMQRHVHLAGRTVE